MTKEEELKVQNGAKEMKAEKKQILNVDSDLSCLFS